MAQPGQEGKRISRDLRLVKSARNRRVRRKTGYVSERRNGARSKTPRAGQAISCCGNINSPFGAGCASILLLPQKKAREFSRRRTLRAARGTVSRHLGFAVGQPGFCSATATDAFAAAVADPKSIIHPA